MGLWYKCLRERAISRAAQIADSQPTTGQMSDCNMDFGTVTDHLYASVSANKTGEPGLHRCAAAPTHEPARFHDPRGRLTVRINERVSSPLHTFPCL